MPDLGPSSPMPVLGLQLERWNNFFALSDLSLFTESAYNVETKTIAVDYGQIDIYPKIEKGLAGLEIGVLGKFLLRGYIL